MEGARLGGEARGVVRRVGGPRACGRAGGGGFLGGDLPPSPAAVRALFWISAALLAWTQALYAPALALLRKLKGYAADRADGGRSRRP